MMVWALLVFVYMGYKIEKSKYPKKGQTPLTTAKNYPQWSSATTLKEATAKKGMLGFQSIFLMLLKKQSG